MFKLQILFKDFKCTESTEYPYVILIPLTRLNPKFVLLQTALLYSFPISSQMLLSFHFPQTFAQPSSHKLTVRSSPLPVGLVQVQQSQEKIARLEQEKEHWLLEAQLGKVRLEKENQRIADLEAQLAAALGGSPNSQAAAASTLEPSHEEAEKEQKAVGKETTLCTSLVSPSVGSSACEFSLAEKCSAHDTVL